MAYVRQYLRYYSQTLQRDMEVLHFGNRGYPLLMFPTSQGRFFDLEDQGMIASLKHHIEAGHLQVFCLETLDQETFFAHHLNLAQRRDRWLALEHHWSEEFIPYVKHITQNPFVAVAGCSLGATHALNLTLRHPDKIQRCLALAGPYDLANTPPLFTDYPVADRERELYFINPMAYMANMSHETWHRLGGANTDIKLLTAHQDICLGDHLRLAQILTRQGIRHQLEIWEGTHDWPVWRSQIAAFA